MNEHTIIEKLESSPFWSLLGIKVVKLEVGLSEVYLPFKPELEQIFSTMHGGVIATLLDAAGGTAFFKMIDLENVYTRTIEIKVNYLKPVLRDQKAITAIGKVIKKGRRIGVSSIEVKNTSNELVAFGIGTFALFPKED
ncbi:MAG: PaaI family thioesterase [Tepidanaerobacteraceae bacterium]|jgi:uncharacterized protein (TIGR00369 family)